MKKPMTELARVRQWAQENITEQESSCPSDCVRRLPISSVTFAWFAVQLRPQGGAAARPGPSIAVESNPARHSENVLNLGAFIAPS
jgi:hypothetical protein